MCVYLLLLFRHAICNCKGADGPLDFLWRGLRQISLNESALYAMNYQGMASAAAASGLFSRLGKQAKQESQAQLTTVYLCVRHRVRA